MSREALIQNPPFYLTSLDIATLRQTNEEFLPSTWAQLKDVIATNALDSVARYPTDLENYIHFTYHIKSIYGSIVPFILQNKLQWIPSKVPALEVASMLPLRPTNPRPFASPQDYKIRRNDWPYGTQGHIKHLVVWLKTPLELSNEGDPTVDSQALVEDFVNKTFRARLGREDDLVMWFRNPTKWQTVRAVEHFHVLISGANEELLESWTGQKDADMEVRKWRDGKKIVDA